MISSFFNREIKQEILNGIRDAKYQIYIAMAYMNDDEIIGALISKSSTVEMELVLNDATDDQNQKSFEENVHSYELMSNRGAFIYLAKRKGKTDIMHHKFMIVDSYLLITGSYNFTNNASLNNHENILVLKHDSNNESIFKSYYREFNYLKKNAKRLFDSDIGLQVSVDKHSFSYGQTCILSARCSTDAKLIINNEIQPRTDYERKVLITSTQRYCVEAMNANGNVERKQITLRLIEPPILNVSISKSEILSGETVKLSWISENADYVSVNEVIYPLTNGSILVTPNRTTVYKIRASNLEEYTEKTIVLKVLDIVPPILREIKIPQSPPISINSNFKINFIPASEFLKRDNPIIQMPKINMEKITLNLNRSLENDIPKRLKGTKFRLQIDKLSTLILNLIKK